MRHLSISCLFVIVFGVSTALSGLPKGTDRADVDTLELVQIMWRHGDRTPIVQYPKDPLQKESLWLPYATGFSSITLKGKLMHYNFGRYLRTRYDGFLNKLYLPTEINIQSSDADRAIMSGLANMAGMWPPTPDKDNLPGLAWQPIPIHTVPKKLDNFINFGADCPRFKELKEHFTRESPFAKSINENPDNANLCNYIIENAGVKECDFETVSDIWDTLRIQKSYNMTLPKWTDSVYDKMEKLAPLFFDSRVLVPNLEAKRVKAGPLMSFLVKNMEEKVKGNKGVAKMYALSGHDTTSSIALGAIDVFDTQFPAYASAAIFELHKINDNHVVKVFFRNSTEVPPYEFEVPKCGYPCKLDKFKEIVSPILVDGDEWKEACKAGGSSHKGAASLITFPPLIMLIGCLVLLKISADGFSNI